MYDNQESPIKICIWIPIVNFIFPPPKFRIYFVWTKHVKSKFFEDVFMFYWLLKLHSQLFIKNCHVFQPLIKDWKCTLPILWIKKNIFLRFSSLKNGVSRLKRTITSKSRAFLIFDACLNLLFCNIARRFEIAAFHIDDVITGNF